MEDVRAGGNRRIDRILAPGFVDDLAALDLADVRARRDEADQEEADLSYLRQVLRGRLEILEDELARRKSGDDTGAPRDDEHLVAHLTEVLAEDRARPPARGLGRHRRIEPSNPGESRRVVEKLVGDAILTDLPNRSAAEIGAAAAALRDEEAQVSARRAQVQDIADALGHEIGRRYREGVADVDALLAPESS